ncbi:MAG: hypothetical protein WA160_09335 [Pseudobdellovibrio sp.]
MKLRHFILFFIACLVLILSDLAGGSLLALFAWTQIYSLLSQKLFNRKTQTWSFLIFLSSAPLIFFWGSIHSFLFVYLAEGNFLFALAASIVSYCLCLITSIYYVFSFDTAANSNYELVKSLTNAIQLIKSKKTTYFKVSCIIFIFSLVPILNADWKIVFAIMATHLFLHRHQLKPVFYSGF